MENQDNTTERKKFLFHSFSVIALVVLTIFGIEQIRVYSNFFIGFLDLVSAGVIALNIGLFKLIRNINLAISILVFSVLIVVMALVIDGGIEGTGIFWVFTLPLIGFFLAGKTMGLIWMAVAYIVAISIIILDNQKYIQIPYEFIEMRQMLVVLGVITILVYLYEKRRQKNEETIKRKSDELETIVRNMPAGVMLTDEKGIITFINDVGRSILGEGILKANKPEIYTKLYSITTEDGSPYPPEKFPLTESIMKGGPSEKRDLFINRRGKKISVNMKTSPVMDEAGNIISTVTVFEDATKEYETDKIEKEFISIASHQLISPLASIRWLMESLQESINKLSKEEKTTLQEIDDISRRLLETAKDLLDVSRIESQKEIEITLRKENIANLIKTAIEENKIIAEKKNISVELAENFADKLIAEIDRTKMYQALENIISNSIKYSKVGGVVTIGCEDKESDVLIYIKDKGLGIPEEEQDRVFKKFYRGRNVQKKTSGTGLGLYIVKAIIESHEGKIWFESKENKGTTFFISIPKKGDLTHA